MLAFDGVVKYQPGCDGLFPQRAVAVNLAADQGVARADASDRHDEIDGGDDQGLYRQRQNPAKRGQSSVPETPSSDQS